MSRGTPGWRGGRLPAAMALVVAVLMSLMAACTAGTAGQGSTGNTQPNNSSGGKTAAGSNRYIKLSPCCSWNTTWSFNPYNVNGLGIQNDFVSMRLAILKAPGLTDFVPQLAESWDESGDKLVVHLQKQAKWEDGTPVTAKDLVDTVYLDATRGDGFWRTIQSATAKDDSTVEFTLAKGQDMSLAKLAILPNIVVYPSSVYGSFVTDELKKDAEAYFAKAATDPEGATSMAEFKRMGAVFQKLAALKVDKLIGNGPFKLDNITTKEAKLSKSPTFWAADKIKVAGIDYLNGSNQTIYPQLFSDGADFSNVYLPPPILKRWGDTEGAKTALPLAFGFVMAFNSNKAPLNIKEVRQALAYVIPRQKLAEAAYGNVEGAGGAWKEIPTGLSPTLDKLYLTPEQLKQLNPYPVDAKKASDLLTSKGFKKQGNQWIKPDGKPFTLTLTVNADTSDIVTSFNAAATALTAFGIKSEVKATSGAQQDADQHNGDFEIGMAFVGGNNPISNYASLLGPGYNFTNQGNYAGKRGIGFGPKMDVPGLGTVDIPSTIANQERTVPPNDEMKKATWAWAQLVNEDMPYLWYATKVYQFSYSTKHFDNWPPADQNGSSELWDIISNNMTGGLSLAMQQGYIVPK
ncbi:ABC transporter substrate-binding protein [Aestuariimicrobium kwangyangense]|uniref:ABC transporter substrate-binding protein n=1 Tax=Aestuariimicrobium kwangyangense TaxID=396389 RepID=UPI00146AF5C3|nr:ABC transporter substrate-binding protein [Aestuariimicrobium kwangyangense]